MILEIDAGNTALKWRVLGVNSRVVDRGSFPFDDEQALSGIADRFPGINASRLSCVAKAQVREKLSEQILTRWGVAVAVAQTKRCFEGLTVVYDDPQRLGVDRWLAMLAAKKEVDGAVCVIDCGSAVTVDMVASDGRHAGGYIVPGLAMQKKTLLSNTGQIRIETEVADRADAWGCSTEQAVSFGVVRMVVSFIDAIVDQLRTEDVGLALFLTGGDAEALLPLVKYRDLFCYRPELVLDGLAIALPFNVQR